MKKYSEIEFNNFLNRVIISLVLIIIIMTVYFKITDPGEPECINYQREVELTCNSLNKIKMITVSDIEPKCSNFLKVNITNYNNTFSNSVDCEVSNCEVIEVKC